MKNAIVHCFVIAIFSISFQTLAQSPDTTGFTKIGSSIPTFSLTTLDGKTFQIDDLKERMVIF